jgi:hypothetical protein
MEELIHLLNKLKPREELSIKVSDEGWWLLTVRTRNTLHQIHLDPNASHPVSLEAALSSSLNLLIHGQEEST